MITIPPSIFLICLQDSIIITSARIQCSTSGVVPSILSHSWAHIGMNAAIRRVKGKPLAHYVG